jgi:hypothetical protein
MINPKPGDEGRLVIYHPAHGEREAGVITSWNDGHVFVRYGALGSTSKATAREQLEWGHD